MERKTVGVVAGAAGTAALSAAAVNGVTVDGVNIPLNLAEIGGWSLFLVLVVVLVYCVVTFKLVPKPYYDAMEARAVAAEASNERLSERASKLTDTNHIQARALEKNAAAADTTIKVMSAVQEARLAATGGAE